MIGWCLEKYGMSFFTVQVCISNQGLGIDLFIEIEQTYHI